MIDLTPLDVRNKRGDFKRLMRGYDPQQVDDFLELVAERLEALVRENIQLKERTQTLQQQVTSQLGREQAVQDALVTAQELRADIREQSQREADTLMREAESEARRIIAEAEAQVRDKLRGVERQVDGVHDVVAELERRRARFIKDFRALLERELDVVEVEERRTPLEERAIDLDLGMSSGERNAADRWPSEPADTSPGSAADVDADKASAVDPNVAAPLPELADDVPSGAARGPELELPRIADDVGPPPTRRTDRGEPSADAGDLPAAEPSQAPAAIAPETAAAQDAHDLVFGDLAASMEAEARAEAHSQVVEVTGADVEGVPEVPRLEEVLAEAGAELAESSSEARAKAQADATEKIDPPRIDESSDSTLLLYPDNDDDR